MSSGRLGATRRLDAGGSAADASSPPEESSLPRWMTWAVDVVIYLLLVVLVAALAYYVYVNRTYPLWSQSPGCTVEGWLSTPERTVDETWVINLRRRSDRWHAFVKRARDTCIPFRRLHRFEGIDAKSLPNDVLASFVHPSQRYLLDTMRQRRFHEQLSRGAVGCSLSHIALWQYAVETERTILVCEDDATFEPRFLRSTVDRMPRDYDILLLYSHRRDAVLEQINPSWARPHAFFSTACYVVTPRAARLLLQHALPLYFQVDVYLSLFTTSLRIYDVRPLLARPMFDGTTDTVTNDPSTESLHHFVTLANDDDDTETTVAEAEGVTMRPMNARARVRRAVAANLHDGATEDPAIDGEDALVRRLPDLHHQLLLANRFPS